MTTVCGRQEFLARLSPKASCHELMAVETAFRFSRYAHCGQFRASGERYFEHPKRVALTLINLQVCEPGIIITALLHDVREDTSYLSYQRSRLEFGDEVANRLELLTKQPGIDYTDRLQTADWKTLFIKLSDRLHNQRTLQFCNLAKQARKNDETRLQYLPLAQQLIVIAPREHRAAARLLHNSIAATIAAC